MTWTAQIIHIQRRLGVQGEIPCLVLIDGDTGEILTRKGRAMIESQMSSCNIL